MTEEYSLVRVESSDDDDNDDDNEHASQRQATDAASWATDWGRLLRIARQVAGLSLTELSTRTGLSKGYLSKLESGARGAANPSRATLAALARALPSFRPVAHTLAPGLGSDELAFAGIRSAQPEPDGHETAPLQSEAPLQLGWRELELLAALIALEAAALPVPATATLLARAVERETAAVAAVLDGLLRGGVIECVPPARVGMPPGYRCVEDAPARLGVARLGDLLVLAAALISGASPTPANAQSPATRHQRL